MTLDERLLFRRLWFSSALLLASPLPFCMLTPFKNLKLQSSDLPSSHRKRPHDLSEQDGSTIKCDSEEDLYAMDVDEEEYEEMDPLTLARTQIEDRLYDLQNDGEDDEEMEEDGRAGARRRRPQTKEEVMEIRRGYAALNNNLTESRAKYTDISGTEALTGMVIEANQLIDRVQSTAEATLDSRFLSQAAEIGLEKVQKLPFNLHQFAVSDFLGLVRATMTMSHSQGGASNGGWQGVGNLAGYFWRGVSSTDFLNGPINVSAKEKVRRTNARSTMTTTTTTVKEAAGMTKEDFDTHAATTSATSKNVIKVAELLSAYPDGVPFHEFITDPTSFSRSVENLFYVSFLVSEGSARLWLEAADDDETGEMTVMIAPLVEEDGEGGEERILPKNQHVFNYSYPLYRKCIRRFRLTEPMIKL